MASPLEADTVEMAEHFWYFNNNKARRELELQRHAIPATRSNDTVQYVRRIFWVGSDQAFYFSDEH